VACVYYDSENRVGRKIFAKISGFRNTKSFERDVIVRDGSTEFYGPPIMARWGWLERTQVAGRMYMIRLTPLGRKVLDGEA
jgi:hypothetical protein